MNVEKLGLAIVLLLEAVEDEEPSTAALLELEERLGAPLTDRGLVELLDCVNMNVLQQKELAEKLGAIQIQLYEFIDRRRSQVS